VSVIFRSCTGLLATLAVVVPSVVASSAHGDSSADSASEPEAAADAVDAPAEAPPAVPSIPAFRPPEAELAQADWLRLESGEWLRGKVEHMRDGELEFDSKKLDDLKIDFDDIAEFYSPTPNRYVFVGRNVIVGTASMQGGQVTVMVDGEAKTFPREELLAILEGRVRELNFWNAGVGLGATGRAGNTNSLDLSTSAYLRRETARTRWYTSYRGAYATLEGRENTNNHAARSQFDWYLTPRLYLIPFWLDFFNDSFQNIDYRLTPAAGVGYELIGRENMSWEVLSALGYQRTGYSSGGSEGTFVIVLGTKFEADITSYLDYDLSYNVNVGIPAVGQSTHHAESTLSFDVWGPLDFDVTVVFDRLERPQSNADGSTPKKNDLRLVVGLGLDL
jgi:hypothetical protein